MAVHANILFYKFSPLPVKGDSLEIVSLSVEDVEDDGVIVPDDKIDGKSITNVTRSDIRVDPSDGSGEVRYQHGFEILLDDGSVYFLPANKNVGLVEGKLAARQTGVDYVTNTDPYEFDDLGVAELLCFFPGTLIATPAGERRIEELVPGDRILTGDGRAVATKWICRQTVSTRFGPAKRLMPVRFAAGSLGGGAPPSAA